MSGPKVVRVVTREEVLALCEGQLARLDVMLRRWQAGAGDEAPTAEQLRDAERRRGELASLLAQDRFLELQKAIATEVSFLEQDNLERQERAAAAAARRRLEKRREGQAAAALLKALEAAGREIPAVLADALRSGAAGKPIVSSVLSEGFALLSAASRASSAELSHLAQSLKVDEQDRRLETWLANNGLQSSDEFAKFDALLAELSSLAGPAVVRPFEDRLSDLADADSGRRKLLLDSFTVDLGAALVSERRRAELRQRLAAAEAELAAIGLRTQQGSDVREELSVADLERLLAAVEAEISAARERQAAEARRRLVLQELGALGYEVGAELSTAWVEDGKVVLRRPAQPGYGVEIAGGVRSDRLQMRVVAFAEAGGDKIRDRDAETRWCGDVDQLKQRMRSIGAELIIEKALPVGVAAVKRVNASSSADTVAREGPTLRSRTLD